MNDNQPAELNSSILRAYARWKQRGRQQDDEWQAIATITILQRRAAAAHLHDALMVCQARKKDKSKAGKAMQELEDRILSAIQALYGSEQQPQAPS